ncbi:AAA family ATPase [Pseudomonas sp. GR 6-02]|uniref:AAA family ATPase n=1 Tax=Pseudomonas sp. GR 6-02 TaxID=1659194 RepID=UPI0007DE2388|nr:AAA family ATPase [Pseudomonas sp. GR 6-02]ANI58301.1 hypothetical protein PGR6_07280 [Pseudomonas sp. GR 6-02]
MQIRKFHLPTERGDQVVLPYSSSKKNRVTILLGANGTRKSTILRGLLDDALREHEFLNGMKYHSIGTEFSSNPSLIIALSAIPNDRFPTKKRQGNTRPDGRYSAEIYEYIGPRHNQNLVSRNQSVQALVSAALSRDGVSDNLKNFISKISAKTGISTRFELFIESQPGSSGDDSRFTKPATLMLDIEKRKAIMSQFKASRGEPVIFDLLSDDICLTYHRELVSEALRYNLIALRRPLFNDRTPEDFSAGQWGLFSTFVSLALRAKDNMLVLIDEPESALHPSWQREYMGDLSAALVESRDCHIVVATHSPLIVSSMSPTHTDLIILRRDELSGDIVAVPSEIPAGWQSNDILEDKFDLKSTRSPELVGALDLLLKSVSEGVEKNKSKIKSLLVKVEDFTSGLPEEDPVLSLLISIKKIIGVS